MCAKAMWHVCLPWMAGFGDRRLIYSRVLADNSTILHIPERPCDAFDWDHHNNKDDKFCQTARWTDYFVLPDRCVADIPRRGATSPSQTCTAFTNHDAFKRFSTPPAKHELLPLACQQYQRVLKDLTLPVLHLHIRRGDVLNPRFHGRNVNVTSVDNVQRVATQLWATAEYQSMTYSTNELNNTYLQQLAAALPVGAQHFESHPAIAEGCSNGHYDSFCIKCNILQLEDVKGVTIRNLGGH